jgi:hypothetical protein
MNAYKVQRDLRRSQHLVLGAADRVENMAKIAADRMRASVKLNEQTSDLLAKLILGKRGKAQTKRLGFRLREAARAYAIAWDDFDQYVLSPGSDEEVSNARRKLATSIEKLYRAAQTFVCGSYDRED